MSPALQLVGSQEDIRFSASQRAESFMDKK